MPLRVAFFGTPGFAVPTLEHLVNSPHEVVGVITQPDRPRGRGQHVADGPVKALAAALRLPVLQPSKLARDPFEPQFAALDADIGVVAAYGKMLPDWLLATPRLGLINVHASLLPRYRGASPVHRAVINGDAETGVTIMRVVKELDAGPMLAAARVPIAIDDTTTDRRIGAGDSRCGAPGLDARRHRSRHCAGNAARSGARHVCAQTRKGRGAPRLDVERCPDPQPRFEACGPGRMRSPISLGRVTSSTARDYPPDRQKVRPLAPSSMPRRWKGCTSHAAEAPRSSSSTSNSKASA